MYKIFFRKREGVKDKDFGGNERISEALGGFMRFYDLPLIGKDKLFGER